MKGRTYERVRCPGCQRMVHAYVPHGNDGRGLRVVPHNTLAATAGHARGQHCPLSDRIVVANHEGGWKVDA